MTAAGVVRAMEAALHFREQGTVAGKTIAVQGAGNVGSALIRQLLERGAARVVASEIDPERRAALLDVFAGRPVEMRAAEPDNMEILAEPCDVLAPTALGAVLGPKTIDQIRAPIVCGAANNQLIDEVRDSEALVERGISYVPDFVANRMGIVYCGNEQYGYVNDDAMVVRHLSRTWSGGIYRTVLRVLELARQTRTTPAGAACRIADELAEVPHPIWDHRPLRIVESLVADCWEKN